MPPSHLYNKAIQREEGSSDTWNSSSHLFTIGNEVFKAFAQWLVQYCLHCKICSETGIRVKQDIRMFKRISE